MKVPMHSLTSRALLGTLCGAVLAACGGGSTQDSALTESSSAAKVVVGRGNVYQPGTTPTKPGVPADAAPTPPPAAGAAITSVQIENTNPKAAQTNVPVTFGQIFAPGHLAKGKSLVGRLDDGSSLALQVDVKATHADGTVRHAIISAVVPSLNAGQARTLQLLPMSAVTAPTPVSASQLLASGFTASVSAKLGGVVYQASADQLLKAGKTNTWLAGSSANEWLVSAPLTTSAGVAHPHLQARFAIRWYPAAAKTRVDVILENNWAYEAAPQNFTYDAQVLVGGKAVYTQAGLTHMHHARWRQLFWSDGTEPQVNVKHDPAYLIASRAVPNYDPTLSIKEATIAAMDTRWQKANTKPMGNGLAIAYMPTTGGRDDIGLLPTWNALYLLTMDKRIRNAALGTANLAGSWSSHYRDKNTDQPISLIDYPYMTLVSGPNDTKNPATGKLEAFPACAEKTACASPLTNDISHQPGFAYLPYMVTGDHYYLEELQFWGMYNVFASNPYYRENVKGLLKPEQVRGQAWALRTLAEVSYITPDGDRLKSHFTRILDSNLDWYNNEYTNNANANKLGIIVNGYAMGYLNGTGMAPWMDDFFTSAIGHAAELGYSKAESLLKWKAKFPVARMVGEGSCYINGAMYAMVVRDSNTSPFFTNIGQAFATTDAKDVKQFANLGCGSAAQATALKLKVGEMTGYAAATAGYPANMQPALAMSASVSGAEGAKAWNVFMSRSVKPDYSTAPQFAIVPRQ